MKCVSLFWTFSLVWTFPYCAGIKSSADSCRWLNAHHISMFRPTKGDTKILARDKGPGSHLQLGFCVSFHNGDRSHLQSMIRDDYPQQRASQRCSPFKRAHRRRAAHWSSVRGFLAVYFWIPRLPKGGIKHILWRCGMTSPDNLHKQVGVFHKNKTKICCWLMKNKRLSVFMSWKKCLYNTRNVTCIKLNWIYLLIANC